MQLGTHQAVWLALVLAGEDLGRLSNSVARGSLVLDAPQTIAEVLRTQLDRCTVDTLMSILLERLLVLVKVAPRLVRCEECPSVAASAYWVVVNGSQLSGWLEAAEAIRGSLPRPCHGVDDLLKVRPIGGRADIAPTT